MTKLIISLCILAMAETAQSQYLPLTGGTLTGPLNGTSAIWNIPSEGSIQHLRVGGNDRITFSTDISGNASMRSGNNVDLRLGVNTSDHIIVKSNGNIGIGTTDPQGYKLAVNGNVIAESVKVALQASWPDYVFHNNYLLMPLSEVEHYIKRNRHLPDIPSADVVKQQGLNLGEMNSMLLLKIEELTLYLIGNNKELKDLQDRMRILEGNK